jgi:hypothetical protein
MKNLINMGGGILRHLTMNNLRPVALGLTMVLVSTLVSPAQSVSSENQPSVFGQLPDSEKAAAISAKPASKSGIQPELSPSSWSGYCLYRFNGTGRIINCTTPFINANSRVFLNISEYSTTATTRFIGAARMTVHNISPYNGGVRAWVDVEWPWPLNVRVDLLVDP